MQAACSVSSSVTWPIGFKLIDVTMMEIKDLVSISLPFSNSVKYFTVCSLVGV